MCAAPTNGKARRIRKRLRRCAKRAFRSVASRYPTATPRNRSLSRGRVADGLNIVAIEIEYEGAVVVGVIMRPEAWRPVVLAAGGESGAIEGIDGRAGRRQEGDMDVPGQRLAFANPERGLAALEIFSLA